MKLTIRRQLFLPTLLLVVVPALKADVVTPEAAPPIPAGYCSTIYTELNTDLTNFNTQLQTPPTWTPVPGAPTLFAGNLSMADANVGPGLSGPNYIQSVQTQLQELQAEGITAVMVSVGFPVLYEPFYGSQTALQPYLTFYTQVAQAVRAAGLKLIVEDNVLLADDIESGWTNLTSFYDTYANNWTGYMAARAAMAVTVAQTMQPDYLVLAEEPDGEATQTGQTNMNIPADAAELIAGEIAAVRGATNPSVPNTKLGAGFGSWAPSSQATLQQYLTAYVQLPLDYIDFHVYPINTENGNSFIDDTLLIASTAAASGLPVAVSEAFLWKMENSEWNVENGQYFRARQPFPFWQPIDQTFMQTMQSLANYTNMIYMAPEGPQYLFAYQSYGGTTENGGAATCTCTTASCDAATIVQTENTVSTAANQAAQFSLLGLGYYGQLVAPPDTTPPTTPTSLTGSPGYTQTNFSWNASTDNVGVAGYNIFRCSPVAPATTCTGVQVGTTSLTSYVDPNLASNTAYNYQVQAFDVANNESPLSAPYSMTTLRTSANSPQSLSAAATSPKEVSLSWTPPSNTTGLNQYLIYSGTSPNNLQMVQQMPNSSTSFNVTPLVAGTTYYFGVRAVESGIDSAFSPVASATTLPLPNSPTGVTASASSATKLVLNWQESVASGGLPIGSYQIYEGATPGLLSKVATVKTTTYTSSNLTPGTTYYYEVVAVDSSNDDSVPSNQIAMTTPPLPSAPTNVSATTPAADQIALTWRWTQPAGGLAIARYEINCGTSSNNLTQVGTATTGTSFTYRSASPGTTYYCDVVAVDSGNDDSAPSSLLTVTTPPLPPAPTNLSATAPAATQIALAWQWTQPQNGLPITRYEINCGTSPKSLSQVGTATSGTSYTYRSASPDTTYYCDVVAVDTGNDDSAPSTILTITTPPNPNAPANVQATAVSATKVTVAWSETIPQNGLSISNYSVYRGTSPTSLSKLATTLTTTYNDNSVQAGVTYYYGIEASDSGHDTSAMSSLASVIP